MGFTALRGRACKQVLGSSRARREDGVVIHWAPSGLGHNRYAVAAKTSTGGAVVRNRIRRWARELLRGWDGALAQGYDMVVIARGREAAESYGRFRRHLATVLRKAGLSADELIDDAIPSGQAGRG